MSNIYRAVYKLIKTDVAKIRKEPSTYKYETKNGLNYGDTIDWTRINPPPKRNQWTYQLRNLDPIDQPRDDIDIVIGVISDFEHKQIDKYEELHWMGTHVKGCTHEEFLKELQLRHKKELEMAREAKKESIKFEALQQKRRKQFWDVHKRVPTKEEALKYCI